MGTNKRAIVMGASSGMGREVARLLLAKGWHVGLAARRKNALDELCNEYPQLAVAEQVDVTKPDAEERLHALIEQLGGMDVYVHMSGIGKQNLELESDIELSTVDTNGLGFTRLVGAAFRYFRDKKRDEIGENTTFEANNDAICLANNTKSTVDLRLPAVISWPFRRLPARKDSVRRHRIVLRKLSRTPILKPSNSSPRTSVWTSASPISVQVLSTLHSSRARTFP